MKRKLNYTAALATTATVALLAGGAHAQLLGGSKPAPDGSCTTTMESPAINNCVMPTAKAPGGGSIPGSFLIPGTNTSFAVHGIIWLNLSRDTGPHQGSDTFGDSTALPVEGPGVTSTSTFGKGQLAAHAANGGLGFETLLTRPTIETDTPTAYGLLKTWIEFDFNQTSGSALAGNADLVRLRQAYGTLGPWLIGQTITLYDDPQTYPDIIDGSFDATALMSPMDRKVQFRYTQLLGNGLSVAASVEMPNFNPVLGPQIGFATDTTGNTLTTTFPTNSLTAGYINIPTFVAAAQWDQPWGHVKFSALGGTNDFRSSGTLGNGTTPANLQTEIYAFSLTGHLNTWGKDLLRGGVRFNHGASGYADEMIAGGELYNQTTGVRAARKLSGFYVSYEHFWNGQWRSNVSGGVGFQWGNPGFSDATIRAQIPKREYTAHLNVWYSPVPQTDFGVEYAVADSKRLSDAEGKVQRIEGSFKFYF